MFKNEEKRKNPFINGEISVYFHYSIRIPVHIHPVHFYISHSIPKCVLRLFDKYGNAQDGWWTRTHYKKKPSFSIHEFMNILNVVFFFQK